MTDNPRPLRKQVIVPPGHGPCIENSCRGNALPHSTEARHRIPEPLGRSIKTQFSIRKSAPKHVPLIFAASVCATYRGGRKLCISHMVALGDMAMFYGQWQEIFSFYDTMFLDMDCVGWVRPLL